MSLFSVSGWIFISGSGPETVEVSQGKDVTLACSNISTEHSQTVWFRLVNRINPNAIASMFSPTLGALNCPGFDKSKFKMTSNISTLFVHIMRADSSDSGLYFCGMYTHHCIEFSTVTFLNVTQFQGKIIIYCLTCFSNKWRVFWSHLFFVKDGEDDNLNDLNESQSKICFRGSLFRFLWRK